MSKQYHRPLSREDEASIHILNQRFSQLDRAIKALYLEQGIEAEAGEALSSRDTAYLDLSDGLIYRMDSDAAGPKAGRIRGFVDSAVSMGQTARLVISGLMSGFTGLSPFQKLYVGTSAGSYTQSRPNASLGGSQVMIAIMGFAVSATEVFVRPEPITYQIRDSMALDDSLTIVHHRDEIGYLRRLSAQVLDYASETITGYASSNQDVNVALADRIVASYGADQCSGGTASADTALEVAANAFDNNNATRWTSTNTATPHWLEYNFGASKTIRRYTVRTRSDTAVDRSPKTFELQYYDGSTWVAADSRSNETGWSLGEQRTYNVATIATSTRWRIYVTANDGSATYTHIAEMEMMEAATFTDGPTSLAQTFNLASTETINGATLWLKKVAAPAGTLTIRIETVSGGNPTGTLANANATATFAESSLTTSYTEIEIDFVTDFSLASGDYALVITTSRSANEANYIQWGADGSAPSYSGGEMRSYAGSWSAESKDAVFSVYYKTSFSTVARVSTWSSSFALLGSRYGDASGADRDTKTSFKCLNASGIDDAQLYVEMR